MTQPFDPTSYVSTPILNVAGAVALGSALVASCPKTASADLRKSAKALRAAVIALQAEWGKRDQSASAADKRASDLAVDNGWAALFGRLEAFGWLPDGLYPDAVRARQLKQQLFPQGLSFLTLPYAEEWAESDKRLRGIDDANLGKDIDRVAGPQFLQEVRRAHGLYGEALGITRAAQVLPEVKLAEPLRRLQQRITRYALKIAALADEDDPASIEMVRSALRPIDDYRAAQARRGSGAAEPSANASPTSPVPEVPAGSP